MLSLNDLFKDFKIDEFTPFKLDSKLSSLDLDKDILLYFDSEDNHHLEKYIQDNYSLLKSQFTEVGKNFIYLPNVEYPELYTTEIIKFYFPQIDEKKLSGSITANNLIKTAEIFFNDTTYINAKSKEVLDYLGYNGSIKSGYIFFNNEKISIIECDNNLGLKPCLKLLDYFSLQKEENERLAEDICFSQREFLVKANPYKDLDTETIDKLKQIESQLKELKSNGQLLFALPILKKIISDTANGIDLGSVSKIHIDEDFNIRLPHFNNLEIPLSHLTKAVYILFYNHPKGINIKELHRYKEELKDFYSSISNQSDYDKMMQSIEDLIDPSSKAIYTHISRIKSAFYRGMDEVYAKNYIITGNGFGNDIKRIPILEEFEEQPF
ncbi:hypothetical protein [Flavobacterium sp. A45]|uniref:hypothetical protein n=1 Tax=Flavobacterium sp. A45 TaxID=1945862 RepID=UPI0009843590|nr:hypothetical protein [Flavobacterium sp. A45]OOG66806.1 hypothetical protein B0E44_14755 [Flavobacterium sp. A45]